MADETKTLGHWVAFEGPDGSGKTTLVQAVFDAVRARGRRAYMIQQPSGGPVGNLLRRILRGEIGWVTREGTAAEFTEMLSLPHWQVMALLFAADRKDQYERQILPALKTFPYLFSDRGPLSNLIYQTAKAVEGISPDDLGELSRRYREALSWLQEVEASVGRPDLTFVLSLSPEIAADRRKNRGEKASVYEYSDMQRRISAMYASAAKTNDRLSMQMQPMIELDALKSVPDLVDECIEQMDAVFNG